jgi:hypothetical protein
MQIKTTIYGDDGSIIYYNEMSINPLMLTIAAEGNSEEKARQGGASYTQAGINIFAQQLDDELKAGEPKRVLEKTIVNMAVMTWLFDSIFCGVTAEAFVGLDLTYTIYPGGAVQLDKAPARDIGSRRMQ